MDKIAEGFMEFRFFILLCCLVFFLIGSCIAKDKKSDLDRSTKCFEQTQDKKCWGVGHGF